MNNSVRSRLGANEDLGPGLELRQLAVQVLFDFIARRVDLENSLKLTRKKFIDGIQQKSRIPPVRFQCLLEQLMEKRAIEHGCICPTSGFDPIL
jgi:hypothetical protein